MEQVTGTYHVFINHRGPDTKRNLASLIYRRLTSWGLHVFLDKEELPTGDTIYPAIRRAIDSASVHVALFFPRYAESQPCLDELCRMLRSSHERTIIPVFCEVEAADLRHVFKGPYAEAFHKHQQNGKVSMEVVKEWQKALIKASYIAGRLFKSDESDLGTFLEDIVQLILKTVKLEPFEVGTYPVGLEEATQDFQNKFMNQIESKATKIVVIAGMVGSGKSTLAKHIYNVRRSDFRGCCHLLKVREKDLQSLQQQLKLQLVGLRGLQSLILLDDVDDREKIKSLLDIHMDSVEPGSLILVTSRDKDILKDSSANTNTFIYDRKLLKRNHAQELFCRHAFHQSNPREGYEDLIEGFLDICGGMPLCLKVFGERLAANLDIRYWKQQLENYFDQGRPLLGADDIINTLKASYEALNPQEKITFLDVGCFLVGEDTELAIRVLEGLGLNARAALQSLRQKCFLDFSTDVESDDHPTPLDMFERPNAFSKGSYKIIMLDQVRELARQIARKDFNQQILPPRVSCSYDIEQILQLQSPSIPCEIRGIRIAKRQNLPQLTINITGVRVLVIEHHMDFKWFLGSGSMSGNLVWLRLCHCHLRSIPPAISLHNLRVLELEGSGSELQYSFRRIVKEGFPEQLQELNIRFTETSRFNNMVNIINNCINLNKLELKNNIDVKSFSFDLRSLRMPLDCSNIANLKHLDLSGCTNLIKLPDSFSKLLFLQYLTLRDCKNLSFPTDMLGEISTLEYVDFSGCAQLVQLPKGMANQKSLKCLDLRRTNVLRLPENLKQLDKLELRIGNPELT